ncbi:MAG: ABC transporter [Planctomycetota bacterium]|nr:MAG: ABC transporter [Planctomycetota bacterium]
MSDSWAVEFDDVSFAYGAATVLEGATFHIPPRSLAAVVGPNGGGKTTMLKLMLGLLAPDSGQVRVLGEKPSQARRAVGYMPQHSLADLRFPVNVMDVVLMGRVSAGRLFGPYSRADRDAAAGALESVGLGDLAGRNFAALSGGQRQRVLIARAIAPQPELLLLDEPTASLDMRVGYEFYDLLAELNQRMTILIVSHDAEFVSQAVTTVVCVQRKVSIHPTEDVTDELIGELYGRPVRRVRHEHNCVGLGCQGQVHR